MKGLITHAAAFNVSAPGVNTDILSSDVTVKEGCALKVTVALTTGSVFNVVCSDGTTEHTWGLNASTALNAGDLYTFTFGMAPFETNSASDNALLVNFQVETDGVIELLIVQEAQL